MSVAKDQAHLCEGMAEEILNALVHVEGLRVASRSAAFRAEREHDDLQALGRALGVAHVLEGSVRTSGARLRVGAQLIEALLVERVVARASTLPILLIGTYRDAETERRSPFDRTLARLLRQPSVGRMSVTRFGEEGVREILEALGGSEPPAELVRALHRETDGKAFFIEARGRYEQLGMARHAALAASLG